MDQSLNEAASTDPSPLLTSSDNATFNDRDNSPTDSDNSPSDRDNTSTDRDNTSQLSFNSTLLSLFGPTASQLAKHSSNLTANMSSYSCHISFLNAFCDHYFIPKGLRLTPPVKSTRATQLLHTASTHLITERLNHFRTRFSHFKIDFHRTISQLESLISPEYFTKLQHLNVKKSTYTHRKHLQTHSRKFTALLTEYDTPFVSPYASLTTFDIPTPTFHGPLSTTVPTPI
jgi:hypothetical protein